MTNSVGGNPAARKGVFLLTALTLAWFLAAFGPAEPALRGMILSAGILVAASAVFRPAWGLSAFLFFLMTANNWPYFFQTRHSVYFIPIAAVLFGFLAAGLALRRAAPFGKPGGELIPTALPVSVRNPVRFAAAVTVVSAAIACWRWTNFFPFRGKEIFDWMTNSDGLPAALARRSVVLTAAGYLLPIAFLAIAVKTMRNRAGVEAVLRVSTAGLGLAVVFGCVQHFAAPGLGNTDFWVVLNQINATFINPNAFGGVLAIMLPILGAAALDGFAGTRGAGKRRVWAAAAAATFALGLFAFFWIGARSALLAFAAGAAVFALGALKPRNRQRAGPGGAGEAGEMERAAKQRSRRRWIAAAAVVMVAAGGALFFRSRLFVRLKEKTVMAVRTGDVVHFSPERYFLWKHALAMTRDYPLSGVGIGAYIVELPNYYARDRSPVPAGLEGSQRRDSAENFFLQAAAETGAVGLAAWIAVFAGLAWEIRRAVREGVLRGPNRRLYLGAAGGLAAFFVNSFFHSFVQSYETLFCFWLAAAICIVLGPGEGRGRPAEGDADGNLRTAKRRISKTWTAAAVAGLLVFAGFFLSHSLRGLSIAAISDEFGISQEYGLDRPEKDETGTVFRWTRDIDAAWTIEVTGRTLQIPVRISHPDAAERPVRVAVSLGKYLLREEVLLGEEVWTEPGRKVLEFPVPEGYSGKGSIRLRVDRTWVPSLFGDSKDSRRLGAAVEFGGF